MANKHPTPVPLFSGIKASSLRVTLSLWAALGAALAVLLVCGGLYFSVNELMRRSQVRELGSASGVIIAQILEISSGRWGHISADALEALSAEQNLQLRLSSAEGSIQTSRFPRKVPTRLETGDYQLQEQLLVVRPIGRLQLTVASDARALGQTKRAFLRGLIWLLPPALLLSLMVGWVVSGRLLKPVAELENAARLMGAGDLRRPLPAAHQTDELGRLAGTLQDTFAKLADAREREQTFLRAAAHDLRSPLTALQARVDQTLSRPRDTERYTETLRELGRDITRLSGLANHLLLLARDPQSLGNEPINLSEMVADAVDRAREIAPDMDIDMKVARGGVPDLRGDRVLLGQAIWNLTMNAVKHAPGASVVVTISSEGEELVVSVSDTGKGVSAEVLAQLGQAFWRPQESRTGEGHGLGLALVTRAAELHGGRLELTSTEGTGFCARLYLPVMDQRDIS